MCDCDLCKIRRGLLQIQKIIDDLPETGTSFYDDPISEIYNAVDDNVGIFYCLEAYEEMQKERNARLEAQNE